MSQSQRARHRKLTDRAGVRDRKLKARARGSKLETEI